MRKFYQNLHHGLRLIVDVQSYMGSNYAAGLGKVRRRQNIHIRLLIVLDQVDLYGLGKHALRPIGYGRFTH